MDRLADEPPPVFDHDHGAVVKVADALADLLASIDHLDLELLARDEARLDRVGQLVDVQDVDVLDLRNLVEVEIGGQQVGVQLLRQLDQLAVDSADLGEVRVNDLDVELGIVPQRTQDV